MKTSGNTILITGGGTGIGRGLAEAFHSRGNQVIITGRRKEVLEEVAAENKGMRSYTLDITSPEAILEFAARVTREVPGLNAVINNAGIMKPEDIKAQNAKSRIAEETIFTNLLGPIRLTEALLPHFLAQKNSTVMFVSSGLAFTPLAATPTYCATKAAIHSYAQSVRFQLRDTPVEVLELAPPYVQTELLGQHQASDPRAMPLDEFISELMQIIETGPKNGEICVERVKPLRSPEAYGGYDKVYAELNSMQH